jgi:membrane protease YdiL (CAAX protease family)
VETSQKVSIKILITILAAILIVEWAQSLIVSKGPGDPMIILGMTRLCEIILILLIVTFWGNGLEAIGLDLQRVFFGIKKGLIWSFGFGILAFFVSLALFLAGVDPFPLIRMPMNSSLNQFLILILIGGILAPIAEEVFFRGVLYGFFRRWGLVPAVIVSTLLFVLVHPLGQSIPVIQIVGGILFAVAYEVEGNLVAPITIHTLGNCTLFTISYFV